MSTPLLSWWLCLTAAAAPPDSALTSAQAALNRGQPWEATRAVAPLLADSTCRSPAVVFLAATAASQWGGWGEVQRLLASEPWLDSLFAGEPRRLLTRAALERRTDSAAAASALAALRVRPDSTSAELLVLLAQALERMDARDSAAAVYQRAADRLPEIAEWLRLRAKRATEEQPVRLVVREELLAAIRTRPGATELRGLIAVLDSAFPNLTPSEELIVARSAGVTLAGRAVQGYGRALPAGIGTSEDRFDYATALFRLGRYDKAAFQFNLVTRPRSLAALAAYQRARALVRDRQLSEAHSALLDVAQKYPRDTAAAASALFLLGDLATDRQEDRQARVYFRRLAARYPSSRFAPTARFRAAIIAFAARRFVVSAREFGELARRYPSHDEATAATYWAGRALAAAGDSAAAKVRWEAVAKRQPLSYYGSLSARRLGRGAWAPQWAPDSFAVVPAVDSAMARAALLHRLGLTAEARMEYARLVNPGPDTRPVEHLLTAADALRRAGRGSEAIQLARRAQARGAAADARLYRLLYPVLHRDALFAEAAERRLDPTFVAALIRQESNFNPAATSPVGARGLMQIMPQVGAKLAASQAYPVWDPVLLYQPDVSLELGILHLQELAGRYDHPVRILAAYNAGASRVERWDQKDGVDDPEVFAERIPYAETRDYVRIIQRNQELYRALYQM